jgi:hypothetical protein
MLSLGTVPEWCATLATFVSLKYLIDYAKAAKAQVDASHSQVRISEKQINISQEQIRVSQEQIRVSQAQARIAEQHMLEQMRPFLVMTALETGENQTARFTIQNQGGGAAFDIQWESQSFSREQQRTDHRFVLGPNAQLTAPIHLGPEMTIALSYGSAFGEQYRSDIRIVGDLYSTRCYPASSAEPMDRNQV